MLTEIHKAENELKITQCQDYFYQGVEPTPSRYIYHMDNSVLYQRIKQRLEFLELSERQASIDAAGNPQFIRNIRKGASLSPRAENMVKLARTLQCSAAWLMGISDDPTVLNEPPQGVRFGGIVEAGTFRAMDGQNQELEGRVVDMPPDPRYPREAQFAFEVVGDSMTEAKIFAGMHLLAVDIHAWQKLHGEPSSGKLVIVARTRNGDPERELTVKRLHIFRDRLELRPESKNPVHQPLVFPNPPRDDDHQEAQIIAVVLSSTWLYS